MLLPFAFHTVVGFRVASYEGELIHTPVLVCFLATQSSTQMSTWLAQPWKCVRKHSAVDNNLASVPAVRGILEWYGHYRRQCIEVFEARERNFHFPFSVVWMGSHSTVVLCTALLLTCAFRVIRDITERKKSILKARYGKQIRQTAVRSRRNFWDNETWAAGRFKLHACTTFTSVECHHVRATPPRLYSPRLLIVRPLKSDTAKTVPAVPAAPALGFAHTVDAENYKGFSDGLPFEKARKQG